MSNPDLPGSSWRGRSEFARGAQGRESHGHGGNYDAGTQGGWSDGRRGPAQQRGAGNDAFPAAPLPGEWYQAPVGVGQDQGHRDGGYGGYPPARSRGRHSSGRGNAGAGQRGNGYAGSGYGDSRGRRGQPYGDDLLPGGADGLVPDDIGRGHPKGYRGSRQRRRSPAGGPGQYGAAFADEFSQGTGDPRGPAGPWQPGGPGFPPGGRGGGRGRGPSGLHGPLPDLAERLVYGRWWRHWSLKKVLVLAGSMIAALMLVVAIGFVVVYNHYQVPLAGIESAQQQSTVVYFAGGHSTVGTFGQVNRTVLSKFPPMLEQAFFAAEDRNFLHEGGISLTGTARALFVDLTGGNLQGGSTITEQLVKNYYEAPGTPRTLSTKLAEIVVAIKLAKLESKDWILAHYLNTIFLGPKYMAGGAYGVQAAAEAYFGRPVAKLTLSQDAMLAALPKEPSLYDARPGTGYWHTQLVQRWQYVIANMVRDNAISQAQANAASFPAVIKPRVNQLSGYNGYVMSLVYNELRADGYSDNTIYNGGLRVYTSINKRLMNALYRAVHQNKALMRAMGRSMPWYVHVGAVLEQPGTGQIVAFYGGPGYDVRHCKKLKCQLNTILAPEPVGSSFKPYVLATAVSLGMNAQTSVLNSHSPLCIPPDWTLKLRLQQSKQTSHCNTHIGYWPFNEASENTSQNLTVPDATAFSNDPAYEDLIHRTGVQPVINMAARLGVSPYDVAGLNALFGDHCRRHHPNCHPGSVVAALGAGSLTAVDQANTFATLVSGGLSATPHVVKYVMQGTTKTPAKVSVNRALTPAQAADADYALSFDTTLPGATGLNAAWDRPVIAKTGTLGTGNNASQAWFIGAIPQYSLAVGMFTDQPQANPPQVLDGLPAVGAWAGSYGGAWPARIWHTFMSQEFSRLPVRQLPTPSFSSPPFFRWVQAPPVRKRKPPPCSFGKPGHKQHGHGHGHWAPQPCPSPAPTPSGAPSPSGPPTPGPTTSPTPIPTPSNGPPAAPRRSSQHRSSQAGTLTLGAAVLPSDPQFRRLLFGAIG